MIEYWERTQISGTDAEGMGHFEDVLHRRGEDPLVMACRRNRELAGCHSYLIQTDEAFMQIREERDARRTEEIPKDQGNRFEEWDW